MSSFINIEEADGVDDVLDGVNFLAHRPKGIAYLSKYVFRY